MSYFQFPSVFAQRRLGIFYLISFYFIFSLKERFYIIYRPASMKIFISFTDPKWLCLKENFYIIYRPKMTTINSRKEIFNSCIHKKRRKGPRGIRNFHCICLGFLSPQLYFVSLKIALCVKLRVANKVMTLWLVWLYCSAWSKLKLRPGTKGEH